MKTSREMRLLSDHPLDGFGHCGEGMVLRNLRESLLALLERLAV